MCDELLQRDEIIDCGLVFGRQGIRLSGFFDEAFAIPQPLNAVGATVPLEIGTEFPGTIQRH